GPGRGGCGRTWHERGTRVGSSEDASEVPRAIATGLLVLAAAAAMLAGCGGSGRSPRPVSARERACVGAVVCPYERVELIGRRGEGVLRAPEAIAVGRGGRGYGAD